MVSDTGETVSGEWHAARSNVSSAARLKLGGTILLVLDGKDGHTRTQAEIGSVEISHRIGAIPRELHFPDGSLFETSDNDGIDRLLQGYITKRSGLVNWLEQFRLRLVGITLCAVLLAYGTYKLALPAMVEVAVAVTPPIVPQIMSSSTLEALDRTVFSESALPVEKQDRIRAEFARIATHAEGSPETYKLNFRDGGYIGPNAFALPDGTIVLTDELVELAGDDTQMITGVLAHEIGHVEYEHSLRQLYRAAGVAGLVMLVAGDVGSAMEDILTQGGGLLALSHSRDAEHQADRRSVELMRAAGLDATAIERFFAILEEKLGDKDGTTIISTHPGTPERRKAILDYNASLDSKPAGQ
ncbi:M48 family metallopeptidase [Rhizobium sp. RM]|uniref:M48 family metallopeptidase n=1 Tax=Rhizobium sp. RM TaxID=2748079 RepID=UPI00110EAFA5|nr:M48 family metallopeptidase [Rhizobium sp. RM]NWJ24522.1 M48 family metallopeptidase [Rhizobium sp. RM]TMV16333.1 M48 family metallopeptidase [Rhizobium sp. Td3]